MTVREFLSTVYIVDKGKVLLTWNEKVKGWIPVGGHIEPNELPCASAVREALEESGLEIELFSPFDRSKTGNLVQPVHVHLDKITDDHHHINMIYFGRVKGGFPRSETDERKPLKWFSGKELERESLMPSVREWALQALGHAGR